MFVLLPVKMYSAQYGSVILFRRVVIHYTALKLDRKFYNNVISIYYYYYYKQTTTGTHRTVREVEKNYC